MLAQLSANARQQHGEPKRLADIVIGPGLEAEDRVGIGVVPGQHDDRSLEAVLAQHAHRLAPVHVGQADVHDDEIDMTRLGDLYALGGVFRRHGLELVMERELLDKRFAHVYVVVDDQNSAGRGHQTGLGIRDSGDSGRK